MTQFTVQYDETAGVHEAFAINALDGAVVSSDCIGAFETRREALQACDEWADAERNGY